MGEVLAFPNRRKHQFYNCPGTSARCIEGRCSFCEGGLSYCEVCKKGENELEEFCEGSPDADRKVTSS